MKTTVFLGATAAAALTAGIAGAQTLGDVQERGTLNCGVTTGLVGFAAPNASGEWSPFGGRILGLRRGIRRDA